MQKLHLVGITTDRDGLILSVRRGARSGSYVLAVDADLVAAIEEHRQRQAEAEDAAAEDDRAPRPESSLSVREIQARLRRGRSVAEVAAAAGVEEDWVSRFAPPVLAERARVIAAALALSLDRPRLGPSSVPLGEAVARHLADRGICITPEEQAERWTAHLLDGGRWSVRFSFRYRGKERLLAYELDEPTASLAAADRTSGQMGYVAPKPPPPGRASVRREPSRSALERDRATAAMQEIATRHAAAAERAVAHRARQRAELADAPKAAPATGGRGTRAGTSASSGRGRRQASSVTAAPTTASRTEGPRRRAASSTPPRRAATAAARSATTAAARSATTAAPGGRGRLGPERPPKPSSRAGQGKGIPAGAGRTAQELRPGAAATGRSATGGPPAPTTAVQELRPGAAETGGSGARSSSSDGDADRSRTDRPKALAGVAGRAQPRAKKAGAAAPAATTAGAAVRGAAARSAGAGGAAKVGAGAGGVAKVGAGAGGVAKVGAGAGGAAKVGAGAGGVAKVGAGAGGVARRLTPRTPLERARGAQPGGADADSDPEGGSAPAPRFRVALVEPAGPGGAAPLARAPLDRASPDLDPATGGVDGARPPRRPIGRPPRTRPLRAT